MGRIISVHSFRGGTGKSNITANIAAVLAGDGRRVGVVDTDIQSPGVHVLFDLDRERMSRSLNDYLWGRCALREAAHDVTANVAADIAGRIFLVPSSIDPVDIARVMHEGYDVALLNEETLLSIAICDSLAIVLRPDRQDYEGTSVAVAVARRLGVPRMTLVVNKTPSAFDAGDVRQRVERAYECEVAAVLPHCDELMVLASAGVFVVRHPTHPVSELFRVVARQLAG